jgi:hypothetical protein
MEFYLTYEGNLRPDGRPVDKHAIRKHIHPQLKELWLRTPGLNGRSSGPDILTCDSGAPPLRHTIPDLSCRFSEYGFRWVPLITADMSLLCEVDILFLRHGTPGSMISGGDLDARLKTVFDALQKPQQQSELGGACPAEDEDPFFCLLENDKLVTKASATTAPLLEPMTKERGIKFARLVIKIVARPYELHASNMHFG